MIQMNLFTKQKQSNHRHMEDNRGVSLKVAKERIVWTFVGKLFQALRGKNQRHLRFPHETTGKMLARAAVTTAA